MTTGKETPAARLANFNRLFELSPACDMEESDQAVLMGQVARLLRDEFDAGRALASATPEPPDDLSLAAQMDAVTVEVCGMSDKEVARYLCSHGIDPDTLVPKFKEHLRERIAELEQQAANLRDVLTEVDGEYLRQPPEQGEPTRCEQCRRVLRLYQGQLTCDYCERDWSGECLGAGRCSHPGLPK